MLTGKLKELRYINIRANKSRKICVKFKEKSKVGMSKNLYISIISLVLISIISNQIITNFDTVLNGLQYIWNIITPFILGISIAYILLPIYVKIKELLLKYLRIKSINENKFINLLSLVVLMFLLISSLLLLLGTIIPELMSSLNILGSKIPNMFENINNIATQFYNKYNLEFVLKDISWLQIVTNISLYINEILKNMLLNISSISVGLFKFVTSIIFSIYLILDYKTITNPINRFIKITFTEKINANIEKFIRITNDVFKKYITGTLLDALVVGSIFFVVLSLLEMPNALLIGFIQMLSNLVPIFGAWVGGLVSVIFIYAISPNKVVLFIFIIIVIQQIDSSLLQPKIIGNKMGLPGIIIFIAVTIGSQLFGLLGLLFSVPICAIIYNYLDFDKELKTVQ